MQTQAVHPPYRIQKIQPLIKSADIEKALPDMAPKAVKPLLSKLAMDLLKLREINRIYAKYENLSGLDFIDGVLNEMEINLEIHANTIKNLPKNGGFVIVANHPLGLLDGLVLTKLMLQHNPNTKLLANFLLQRIEKLSPHIIPVNPYDTSLGTGSNTMALKQAIHHVRQGHPLIVFPAGEVSSLHKKGTREVCDTDWKISIAKLIMKLDVPIVPVYLHGKNSSFFYAMAWINPMLKSAAIPGEFIRSKGKSVGVIIGHSILPEQIKLYKNPADLALFLKLKTYFLQNCMSPVNPIDGNAVAHTIGEIDDLPLKVAAEMDSFLKSGESVVSTERYEVVFVKLSKDSNILQLLGILRETTFREVGEGTLCESDLDQFDTHYHHLILWDKEKNTIAGSYRMGLGRDILASHGIKGFYTSQLFQYAPAMESVLQKSVEIGRSFITKPYQQRPTPLLLLWKGVVAATHRLGHIDFIFGAASISNQYSDFSKTLMVDFLEKHHQNHDIARMVRPMVSFIPVFPKEGKELGAYFKKDEIHYYDQLIRDLENDQRGIPILVKKYISLKAQYVACSVDPAFSSCLDALLLIRTSQLFEHTLFNKGQCTTP